MQSAVLLTVFEKLKERSHFATFVSEPSYGYLKIDPLKRGEIVPRGAPLK